MTLEALDSEAAYERDRQAKIEWGRTVAGIADRACRYLLQAGVMLDCRNERTER